MTSILALGDVNARTLNASLSADFVINFGDKITTPTKLTEEWKNNISKSIIQWYKENPKQKDLRKRLARYTIAGFNKNKKFSKEHCEKMSKSAKGNKNRLGKKDSEITKQRISLALTGRHLSKEHRNKISLVQLGRKQSKEICLKKSISMKEKWKEKEYREKVLKSMLKSLFKRPTSLELRFIEIIKKYSLPYKYVGDGSFLIGYKNPDFINIAGQKICIEIANKKEKSIKRIGRKYQSWQEYEQQRIEYFAKYCWKCIVIWEDELQNEHLLIEKINKEIPLYLVERIRQFFQV